MYKMLMEKRKSKKPYASIRLHIHKQPSCVYRSNF